MPKCQICGLPLAIESVCTTVLCKNRQLPRKELELKLEKTEAQLSRVKKQRDKLQQEFHLLNQQIEYGFPGDCIHCLEPVEFNDKNHWQTCKKHPARIQIQRIKQVLNSIAFAAENCRKEVLSTGKTLNVIERLEHIIDKAAIASAMGDISTPENNSKHRQKSNT